MALNQYETNKFIELLNTANTLSDLSLQKTLMSYLQRALNIPIRLVLKRPHCLGFLIGLRKEIKEFQECIIFLTLLDDKNNLVRRNAIIDGVNLTLNQRGLSTQPYFMFFFGAGKGIKELLKHDLRGSIIHDSNEFKTWLRQTYIDKEIINDLNKHRIEMAQCPFHHLGPCNPATFVGRNQLIKNILFDSQMGFAIAGGRRIGKTSLLFRLQEEAKNKSYVKKNFRSIYLDCSSFSTYQALMDEIVRIIDPKYYHENLKTEYTFSFQNLLSRATSLKTEAFLLLLDEMDELIKKGKEQYDDSKIFYNALRAESNKSRVKLIIAGFQEITKMIADSKHPFYNLCEKLHLGVLCQEDVKNLIIPHFARVGIHFNPSEEIIRRIFQVTSGHPSVVQLIAKLLFKQCNGMIITNSDLDKVLKDNKIIDTIIDNYLENTKGLERLIPLLTLNIDNFNLDTICTLLEQEEISIFDPVKTVHRALTNLVYNNILLKDGRDYCFLYPLMKSIIREYHYSPYTFKTAKSEVNQQ
jgi:hypothetical protein